MKAVLLLIILIAALSVSCEDDLIYSPEVGEIDVVILDLLIAADLMPFVEPDPIIILMTLQLTNLNESGAFIDFRIPSAKLHLTSDDKVLGDIRLGTNWDGLLESMEIDTIEIRKLTEKSSPFAPACSDLVYLKIKMINSLGEEKTVRTDDILFDCYF